MNRPSRIALAAAALLAAHVHAQSAPNAQENRPPDPSDDASLATVTVTAKGYAADAAETPIATTVLTREDLSRKQARNVGEAVRGEPGLAVSLDGAQGMNPVIRGLKRDSVVLLVDGMRLNSAQPAGAVASFMSLGLADRVEVVKGPASVLYGTGALGGAVNVRLPQALVGKGRAGVVKAQARGMARLRLHHRGKAPGLVQQVRWQGADHVHLAPAQCAQRQRWFHAHEHQLAHARRALPVALHGAEAVAPALS